MISYTKSRRNDIMNFIYKTETFNRFGKQTYGCQGARMGERRIYCKFRIDMYIHI